MRNIYIEITNVLKRYDTGNVLNILIIVTTRSKKREKNNDNTKYTYTKRDRHPSKIILSKDLPLNDPVSRTPAKNRDLGTQVKQKT